MHYQPVDVNQAEVVNHIHNVDLLIHGHTHRPAIHNLENRKQRIVLGDWREDTGTAKILLLKSAQDISFFDWQFE